MNGQGNGGGLTKADGNMLENVLIKGDLSKLNPKERADYYSAVCRSLGLNPLTKPFEYILLNGRLTLYALRACTDQLRTIYKVSVEELSQTERGDVVVVTVKVRNAEGRTDMATGAVNIGNLKGDNLANALMKAETKAKRRATLSICGLGFLDETEIETIPEKAKRAPQQPAQLVKIVEPKAAIQKEPMPIEIQERAGKVDWPKFGSELVAAVRGSKTLDEVEAWGEMNELSLIRMKKEWPEGIKRLEIAINKIKAPLLAAGTPENAG